MSEATHNLGAAASALGVGLDYTGSSFPLLGTSRLLIPTCCVLSEITVITKNKQFKRLSLGRGEGGTKIYLS